MKPVLKQLSDYEKDLPAPLIRRHVPAAGPPRPLASLTIRAAYVVACAVAAAFLFFTRHVWVSKPEEIWAPAAILAIQAMSSAASALKRRRGRANR